jgi:hypothetical protein
MGTCVRFFASESTYVPSWSIWVWLLQNASIPFTINKKMIDRALALPQAGKDHEYD